MQTAVFVHRFSKSMQTAVFVHRFSKSMQMAGFDHPPLNPGPPLPPPVAPGTHSPARSCRLHPEPSPSPSPPSRPRTRAGRQLRSSRRPRMTYVLAYLPATSFARRVAPPVARLPVCGRDACAQGSARARSNSAAIELGSPRRVLLTRGTSRRTCRTRGQG